MQIEHLKKVTYASLMATFLILVLMTATLPFSTASGNIFEIEARPLATIPRIDANWSVGEWDDAFEYAISNGSLTSYVRVKWGAGNITGDFLYVLIDSPWDTIPPQLNPTENYWVAFDTLRDGGAVPQPDDYLFNDGFSDWGGLSWHGDGSKWTAMLSPKPEYAATQNNNATSPHSTTGHTICEFRVPLTHVGPVGSTVGFYILAIDDSADPNRDYTPPGSPRYVEYPYGAGGNSSGWPPGLNPTPAPSAWGNLKLYTPEVIPSDVNGDGIVDIFDGVIIGVAFGSKPGDPKWNPIADIVPDNLIDIQDVVLWALHFGEEV